MDAIPGIILGLCIIVGLFFLFRTVLLWYWKINYRIEIQEKQLQFQKETVELLTQLVSGNKKDITIDTVTKNNNHSVDVANNPLNLTDEEIKKINLKASELKEFVGTVPVNEVVIINTISRIIKKINRSDFSEGKGWVIVKEFEK